MAIELLEHQKSAVKNMHNGCILCGGVGTGKSLTALAYFKENEGDRDLYIITTARKRDSNEWAQECMRSGVEAKGIDSWNNIKKYVDVVNAFFIFDEQRVVGYGAWTKAFLRITKANRWVMLSATPGDCWMDYVPVFIANGFYKNKTSFIREHVIYKNFNKYPKIDRYVNTGKLLRHRKDILVTMSFQRKTVPHNVYISTKYDRTKYKYVMKNRWDPFKDEPVKDASGLCYVLRKIVNSSDDRIETCKSIIKEHPRTIIFYNFDYELELLLELTSKLEIKCAEWNGHKHESVPIGESWVYLVQYNAGAEAWNCTTTNTIIFYSQSYSYKTTTQAAGRIDRMNTSYVDLYYYHLYSTSSIDIAIKKALTNKRNFNERMFA